jgi:hypothetical protein
MNWRAIFWWLGFSVAWTLALFFGFSDRPLLCVCVGPLLGFLTLCALDIWMACRHQRALREEGRSKHEQGRQS